MNLLGKRHRHGGFPEATTVGDQPARAECPRLPRISWLVLGEWVDEWMDLRAIN